MNYTTYQKQEQKEYLNFITGSYGFLLPYHERITSAQFADLVKNTYSLNDSRNKFVYDYLLKLEFTILRTLFGECLINIKPF